MDKSAVFECEACAELLRVKKYEGEDYGIYITKYHLRPDHKMRLMGRIQLAINFIINPRKFDIYEPILLSNKEAKKMGEVLLEWSNEEMK